MKNLKIILLVFAFFCLKANSQDNSGKPNIIFFLVDDMGWQQTSVPFHTETTEHNKQYHTPNMERLAHKGMKFTQAYAAALCSPTRVSLMTGLNAARHGVTNWTLRKGVSSGKDRLGVREPDWNVNGICTKPGIENTKVVNTLPLILQKEGYRTIHVGKAHFGAKDTPGEDPLNLGFDVNIAGHAAGGPGSYYGKNNFSAAFRNGDLIWNVPGLDKYHGKDINLTEVLSIEANKAIDSAVIEKKPFYLYMSHYAIHAPFEADTRFFDKYNALGLSKAQATYASMVESMDKSLGDIMQNIRRHGIEDNTIIVFMSDNGHPGAVGKLAPLRGAKLSPYEGGIRVPLIVHWPGVTKPKTLCNDYLIIEDIFPTFLEMAGVKEYSQIGGVIDGNSFVPLLKGKEGDKKRAIFWHYPNTYHTFPYSTVRKNKWKLIYHHADGKFELFNIENDISEEFNLAEKEPKILEELSVLLSEYLRETKADMPIRIETGKTVSYPDEQLVVLTKNKAKSGE